MLFNKDPKRWAAVRVRPMGEDKYLFFPFDCQNGGEGFIINKEQAERWKMAEWSPFNFVFVPLVFVLAVALLITGFKTHGWLIGVGLGVGAGYLLYQSRIKMYDKLVKELPKAGVQLSEARCWQEYAVQLSGWRVFGSVVFWLLLLVTVVLSLFTNFSMIVHSGQMIAVYIGALALLVHLTRRTPKLLKYYRLAKKNKVVVGSMAGFER